MKTFLSLLLVFAVTSLSIATPSKTTRYSQDPAQSTGSSELTNKDVLEMVKTGLATEIIIAKVNGSKSTFDTTPATLAELKTAGVPDAIIMAMVQAGATTKPAALSGSEATSELAAKVTDGTEIEIQLKNNASGEELKIGDIVDFTVVRPVVVNGAIIFDKDASARARITTAKKAGHWGHAGKLEWSMQDILATDGARVPARFTQRKIGDSKGNTVAVAAVATTVLLGPLGLLWGLKKGKPAIIPAGNRYTVFVHGDTTVKGKAVAVNSATAAPTTP
jgi:hypothetical protein